MLIGMSLDLTGRLLASVSPVALFASGEVGVWYDPSDVANLAWRYNLLTYTEQFDNAAWVKSRSTITANAATAPDGTATADLMVPTAVLGTHRAYQVGVPNLTTQNWTLSAYLKASGYNSARLMVSDGTESDQGRAIFNLTDGTVTPEADSGTTIAVVSSSATAVGSGWYRCSITVSVASAETAISAWVFSVAATGTSFVGDGVSGTLIWGAQLELSTSSTASPYQRISDVNTEVMEQFPKATLFQDNAGTTPVTTPAQTVGLMLDKSKGLVLGSELITNGDFATDTIWTKGTGWTISGGVATKTAGTASNLYQPIFATDAAAKNKITVITLDTTVTAGSFTLSSGGYNVSPTVTASGSYSFRITASEPSSDRNFYVLASAAFAGTIDNVSVKELMGNHAVQATSAQRPTYGINPIVGTRNLLTRTEEFDNAAWTKTNVTVTANATAAPDGTTTADKIIATNTASTTRALHQSFTVPSTATYTFSAYAKAAEYTRFALQDISAGRFGATFDLSAGTTASLGGAGFVSSSISSVGGGWFRCSVVWNGVAAATHALTAIGYPAGAALNAAGISYAGDGTSGIYAWGAQLEASATATAYQKVVTQYEVTEAGVQSVSYLAFVQGLDDGMVTNTITPAIDKVQVFAGVRKLSDAVAGILIESSAISSAIGNPGSFYVTAPESSSASDRYAFFGRGSATAAVGHTAKLSTGAAPDTAVIAATGDISGDLNTIRRNGVAGTSATLDQGTGNYLAYPLYIGRRGDATLPFNGRIYSLIVRFGANLTDGQITSTESWVNSKTGAY